VFKTNILPKLGKSFGFYGYTIETDFGYYVVFVSYRYKLLNIIDTNPVCILGFKDGILTVPFVPQIWSYHKFHLAVNKRIDQIPVNLNVENPLVINNGIIIDGESMEALNVDFTSIYGELFKCYVINFA
jgi:hypothetical protein